LKYVQSTHDLCQNSEWMRKGRHFAQVLWRKIKDYKLCLSSFMLLKDRDIFTFLYTWLKEPFININLLVLIGLWCQREASWQCLVGGRRRLSSFKQQQVNCPRNGAKVGYIFWKIVILMVLEGNSFEQFLFSVITVRIYLLVPYFRWKLLLLWCLPLTVIVRF
jgi:hypothetical protein